MFAISFFLYGTCFKLVFGLFLFFKPVIFSKKVQNITMLSLAVLTSGGDSCGMNSAVRSVVRTGLRLGCRVFFIKEGFQGMIDGDANIEEASWDSVSDIIQSGGTIIGSARSNDFMQRNGRRRACKNLVSNSITRLVCIGGDGSLTGATILRNEWPELLKELLANGEITEEQAKLCPNVQIVGLVGSIDNDFCGTDMTIGTDSALHRIIEAVDAVVSTAQSHQRAFVIEVMGRHCGYLALVAALACEADYCFIPEWPQPENWEEILCAKLRNSRSHNQRLNIIIVAEGAVDRQGNIITSAMVCDSVKSNLHYDTRVTVLGHVQRGGTPSGFDRLLGCRMGAEATRALMEMKPKDEPCVISIDGTQIVRVPLKECVEKTKEIKKAMEKHDFGKALKLRGDSFNRNLETYQLFTKLHTPEERDNLSAGHVYNVAVMNVGAPAPGMNAAVRSFVRMALYHRCHVFGIHDSFDGFASGQIEEMSWSGVTGWTMQGGSKLGTQKQLPGEHFEKIAAKLEHYKIHALLIIGGFEAFHSALILSENRNKFPPFRIPICVIPCTISNNVPGTSLSLGSDTAVNAICQMVDNIKQSATGSKRRVFLIETMGGHCGYLATVSAIATGADNAYIFEEKFTVDDIREDIKRIIQKMKTGVQRYLIVQSEGASRNYDTAFVQKLFNEEGKGEVQFSTRINILGIIGRDVVFSPLEKLATATCFVHRLPRKQWWIELRPLLRLAKRHAGGGAVAAPAAASSAADASAPKEEKKAEKKEEAKEESDDDMASDSLTDQEK